MRNMRAHDWIAVFLLFLLGVFGFFLAVDGVITGAVGTLNKSGSRIVLRVDEPTSFYISVAAWLLLGCICMGFSIYIALTSKRDYF